MPQHWIHKLNESRGRLHKEDVIKQALEAAELGAKDAHHFLTCAWYAYNPFATFNAKQIPVTENITGADNDMDTFYSLLTKLQEREVTGHAATNLIELTSMGFDSDMWNSLLRPTIIKDLRAGATIRTFNKICKKTKYQIPVFEAQLATDSQKNEKKMVGKKFLEPKLDGVRALVIVDRSEAGKCSAQIYSRNGKPFENFPHIEKHIISCLQLNATSGPWQETRVDRFVIDGEIVSENFQALMKQAQRKTDVDTSDSVFTIFDVIPLNDFNRGKWNMPQRARSENWLGAFRDRVNDNCPSLHVLTPIEVDLDTEEGHNIMERFAKDMIELGYEGIMVKDVDAPYECRRGTAWMKWKPTITVDLEVIDMEEGTGRNAGRLGALVCEGVDQGVRIKVNVGGGLSDKQRDDFWARKDELLGFIAEIKADAVTQNQDADDTYSLRFPRFVGFRGFEAGEKI